MLVISVCGCIQENESTDIILQHLIDEALPGDTIIVPAGMYYEHLIINTSITLTGENTEQTILDGNNTDTVITITTDNVTIHGLTIRNGGNRETDAGIALLANNCTITENIFQDNNGSGVYIKASSNNSVLNNYFINNTHGVYLHSLAKNNIISENNISDNRYGIILKVAFFSQISQNELISNNEYGIYLYTGSDDNVITGNRVIKNGYGMRIQGSNNNEVINNKIKENERGLYFCCGSYQNLIYSNAFYQNSEWHARDSFYNQWDNESSGNYWDDYTGLDDNQDGIGDTPYVIDIYNIEIQDRYPLMSPPPS